MPSSTGRSSSGKLYGAVVRAEKERAGDEGARGAMEKLRAELEAIREDLRDLKSGADPKKLKHVQEFLDFSSQRSKSASEDRGPEEGRAGQGGRISAGRARRGRGHHQEDD